MSSQQHAGEGSQQLQRGDTTAHQSSVAQTDVLVTRFDRNDYDVVRETVNRFREKFPGVEFHFVKSELETKRDFLYVNQMPDGTAIAEFWQIHHAMMASKEAGISLTLAETTFRPVLTEPLVIRPPSMVPEEFIHSFDKSMTEIYSEAARRFRADNPHLWFKIVWGASENALVVYGRNGKEDMENLVHCVHYLIAHQNGDGTFDCYKPMHRVRAGDIRPFKSVFVRQKDSPIYTEFRLVFAEEPTEEKWHGDALAVNVKTGECGHLSSFKLEEVFAP
jgi:hypothetical protein